MLQSEALSDRAAHGDPEDDGLFDTEVIQQPQRVVRHLLDRRRVHAAGPSEPAVVERDEAMRWGHCRDLRGPEALVEGEAHDAEDRVAGAMLSVVEGDVTKLGERH